MEKCSEDLAGRMADLQTDDALRPDEPASIEVNFEERVAH